jgi:hypothetical protein
MMMINEKNLVHKMRTLSYFLISIFFIPQTYSEDLAVDENAVWENPFKKDKVDQAIEKGVRFILQKQHEDGSIHDRGKQTAMSALSLMAMAAVGHQPIHPNEFGRAMKNALEFILRDENQDERGYYGNKNGGRMYGHGIITLTLSEMLGMGMDEETDKKIHDQCQNAIDLILRSQKLKKARLSREAGDTARTQEMPIYLYPSGNSWHYDPLKIQVLMCPLLPSPMPSLIWNALINRNCALMETLLKKSQGSPISPVARRSTPPLRQVFLPCRFVVNMNLLLFMVQRIGYLITNLKKSRKFFFYGTYYYAQGMYQRGGDYAKQARKLVEDILLELQRENGSWIGSGSEAGAGEVYSTTLAILALAVKYHYLPIYQR